MPREEKHNSGSPLDVIKIGEQYLLPVQSIRLWLRKDGRRVLGDEWLRHATPEADLRVRAMCPALDEHEIDVLQLHRDRDEIGPLRRALLQEIARS